VSETDSDHSFMFPLPPQITRSCPELELVKSDGGKDSDAKEDGEVLSLLRSRSGGKSSADEGTDEVSDVPNEPVSGILEKRSSGNISSVGTDTSKVSDEPEQPLLRRLRSRSSESKSSIEAGTDKVFDAPDEQLSSKRRSKTKSSVDVAEPKSDVSEDSPVSSQLRKDLPSIGSAEVLAVSPKKSSPHPSNTKPTALSSDFEFASQAEGSQPKKSSSASASPRTSDNICRVTDGTSFTTTFDPSSGDQKTTSPKCSPISSPGSTRRLGQQRASFQLLVNLKSPKSDRIKRLSSSTSSLEDADLWSDRLEGSLSSGRSSSRESHHSSPSTPSRSQQRRSLSAQPASDRKLRSRSRKDTSTSENATRRSQRLIEKKTDIAPSLTPSANTAAASDSTPTR